MSAKEIYITSVALVLTIYIDEDGTAYLEQIIPTGSKPRYPVSRYFESHRTPLVEVRLAGEGTQKHKSSKSLVGSYVGVRLRYKSSTITESKGSRTFNATLSDPTSKITAISHLTIYDSMPILRARTTIRNDSSEDIIVTQVTSLVLGGLTTGSAK
ncbi:hypothetical protein BDW75DRAFT_239187 [Aspergillus navahoensis]